MKALVCKELREVFGITAAALGGYLVLVASLMGAKVFDWVPGIPRGAERVPFVDGGFTTFFTFVSVLFAITLGFRQSAWESSHGTYLFLLHRPVFRSAVFLTKMATGIGAFLLCAGLPIVVYSAWVAMPRHHPGPFAWSMSEPAWQMALLMPLLYLGAFLSGLRPARWFGTRLLPLVASVVFVLLLVWLPWWRVGFPLTVLLCGLLVANVCSVARMRDYA
jgi:hypothetical protein